MILSALKRIVDLMSAQKIDSASGYFGRKLLIVLEYKPNSVL
jgi:hypothetical protein